MGSSTTAIEAEDKCWHDTDKHAHVIWRERDGSGTLDIPEIRIIAVKMFQPFGLTKSVLIQSNVRGAEPSKGCNVPCKKTKMGAGAGGPSHALHARHDRAHGISGRSWAANTVFTER